MVLGDYFSAQRLEVAFDWHHFRTHYLDWHRACLNELGLDQRSYPLPYWVTSRSRPPERLRANLLDWVSSLTPSWQRP